MSQKSKMKILELEQRDEWDKIVRSFNDYDVYWLSGYVKAFEIHGDGKPLLFFYEDDESRGINVVMLLRRKCYGLLIILSMIIQGGKIR